MRVIAGSHILISLAPEPASVRAVPRLNRVRADRPTSATDRSAHETSVKSFYFDCFIQQVIALFADGVANNAALERHGALACAGTGTATGPRVDRVTIKATPTRRRVDIMLKNVTRTGLVGGVWFATLAVIVGSSVAMGATLSTSALLLAMGVLPAIIMMLLKAGAPSPTVAEILHSVDAKDGR